MTIDNTDWLARRKRELKSEVREKLIELGGADPLTPEAQIRIDDAIERQARQDRRRELFGEDGPDHVADLLAWFAAGHNSPATKCLAEVRPILAEAMKKVGAYEVTVSPYLSSQNTIDNFRQALHKLVDEVAEEGREEKRRLWGIAEPKDATRLDDRVVVT
jgi:hypothetical protein